MSSTQFYKTPHRRRLEEKTNYKKRLALVKGNKTRLVLRKSIENFNVQLIDYKKEGDVVRAAAHSKELQKFGWATGSGNLPAAYLTGLLAGFRAKKAGISEAVLDLGLQRSTKGSRLYAALKGVLDSGVNVPHDSKVLPSEKRIEGQHISAHISRLKDLPKQFTDTKAKIKVSS